MILTRLPNIAEEREEWKEYWYEEYKQFSSIEPSNTFECYVGMDAGESAQYAWEQYKEYNS